MNTNKILLKLLTAMLFAALIISCLVSSLNTANANPLDRAGKGGKVPGQGPNNLDLDMGDSGLSGSNTYLIAAIVGIVIVVAVLLIIKFVIPKLKAK
jgi:hypothetical protein